MYDYGNARIAALRARLLGSASLDALAGSTSTAALLASLERSDDWRAIVRQVGPLVGDPAAAAEAAIERHRAARLGALPGWYPGPARALVEALVLPLDLERVIALLRRRHAGEDGESVSASIVPGALLDGIALGRIARAPTRSTAIEELARVGLVEPTDLRRMRSLGEPTAAPAELEAALVAALDRVRLARAAGRGAGPALVRRIVEDETGLRARALEELEIAGPAVASALDRAETLRRLDRLAATGRNDPLGIGAVAGYVAAVSAQAIRLRAAVARTAAGWTVGQLAAYRAGEVA
jgi:vacuolar-type H+-ATPase subunit C/Vma6